MDLCLRATHKKARLEIAVATTTQVVKDAERAHGLGATSTIALGRLLTGIGLIALTSKREGTFSAQVISRGRIRQVFADCTHEGHFRGRVSTPGLAFPLLRGEDPEGRRSIAAAVLPGELSLIRSLGQGEYAQSTVTLKSSEVDEDLDGFLETSEQVATFLAAEVVFDKAGAVLSAGGVWVQALPDGDLAELAAMKKRLSSGGLIEAVRVDSAERLLAEVSADAEVIAPPMPLLWKCRCSMARVLASLKMLGPKELAELVEKDEAAEVDCDLCGLEYLVPIEDVRRIWIETIKAQG